MFRRVMFLIFGLVLLTTGIARAGQWANTYGGADDDSVYSIQQTSDGGYIVAGETRSFGAGKSDAWVLKLKPDGTVDWQKTYGGTSYDYASSIQQTSDGGYIVAGETRSFGEGNSSDVWVLKLDSSGNVTWQKTYGGTDYDYAYSIQQTSDGGYIVAGETGSFGVGESDAWVLKLKPDGTVDWQKTYGGTSYDYASSIQQTSDGGYIVAGETRSFGEGNSSDVWVLKLDSSGNVTWQKTYGGANDDYAYSIQQTSDGGYIVAGETGSFGVGESDAWVLKLDGNGNVQWQKTYGGTYYDYAYSIQQTSDGGYIVAGYTGSFGAGSYDAWVLKLDSNGNITGCSAEGTSSATVKTTNVSGTNSSVTPADTNVTPGTSTATINNTTVSPGQVCYYAPTYTLSVSKSGTGSGTVTSSPSGISCGSDCSEGYTANTSVTLTATADSGSSFGGWGGDCSSCGANTICSITMDAAKSCTATFTQNPPIQQYGLTVSASDFCNPEVYGGTVTSDDGSINCGGNISPSSCEHIYSSIQSVTLTAQPKAGYTFIGWEGVSCGSNPVCSLELNRSVYAKAVFSKPLALPPSSGSFIDFGPVFFASCVDPIGVGMASKGNGYVDLGVMLAGFVAPMDLYLGIYLPDLDSAHIYIVKPNGDFGVFNGLTMESRWRSSVSKAFWEQPISKWYNGVMPFGIAVPSGRYEFYLLAVPAGSSDFTSGYYLWRTVAIVR